MFECLLLTLSLALVERRLFRWAAFSSPLPVSRNIPGGPLAWLLLLGGVSPESGAQGEPLPPWPSPL